MDIPQYTSWQKRRMMRLSRTLSQVSKKLDDIISTLLENNAPDHKKLAEVYHLSHYLPYKWYDDRNDLYISDTSLGLIFEVMPLRHCLLSATVRLCKRSRAIFLRKYCLRKATYKLCFLPVKIAETTY